MDFLSPEKRHSRETRLCRFFDVFRQRWIEFSDTVQHNPYALHLLATYYTLLHSLYDGLVPIPIEDVSCDVIAVTRKNLPKEKKVLTEELYYKTE